MNKEGNILDTAVKYKGYRTCPECGYQFPLLSFIKRYVLKYGFSKWTCPTCHKNIKYNYGRSDIIMVVIFFACILMFLVLDSNFDWDLPLIVFLVPYFIFYVLLLYYARLEEYEG